MAKKLTEAQKERRRANQRAYHQRKRDAKKASEASEASEAFDEVRAREASIAARTKTIPAEELQTFLRDNPEIFGVQEVQGVQEEVEGDGCSLEITVTPEQEEELAAWGFPYDLLTHFESTESVLGYLRSQPVKQMTPRQRVLLHNRRWRGEKKLSRAVAELVLDTYGKR